MQRTSSHILISSSPRRDGLVASRAFSSPVEGEGLLLRIFNWGEYRRAASIKSGGMRGNSGQCKS